MSDLSENYITITDEDGVDYELEILSTLEYNDTLYYALAPATDDDDDEGDLEVSILKEVEENGENILVAITDDAELEEVYAMFIDKMYEDDEEEDEED